MRRVYIRLYPAWTISQPLAYKKCYSTSSSHNLGIDYYQGIKICLEYGIPVPFPDSAICRGQCTCQPIILVLPHVDQWSADIGITRSGWWESLQSPPVHLSAHRQNVENSNSWTLDSEVGLWWNSKYMEMTPQSTYRIGEDFSCKVTQAEQEEH